MPFPSPPFFFWVGACLSITEHNSNEYSYNQIFLPLCGFVIIFSLWFEVYSLDQMPFKLYQEITEHLSYVKYFCAKNGELISVKTKAS